MRTLALGADAEGRVPALASRSARMACLRWSRVVRSRISTPSRWSISCWSTRASRPEASISCSSPCSSCARTRTCTGPLDLDEHAGQRQAALLERLALLAGPLEHRVDDGGDRRVGVDAVDEHAVHHADLRGREADAERVVHEPAHPADLLGEALVELLDLERAAAQHRVAVLADELQRGVAARARLRVDPVAELLGLLLRCGAAESGPRGPWPGQFIAGRRRR